MSRLFILQPDKRIGTEPDRARQMSRRAFVLLGGKAAVFTALGARLYHLQVMESERYSLLSEDNRISFRLTTPHRGLILDRNGIALAVNQPNYRVHLIAEQTDNIDDTLHHLSSHLTLSEQDIERIHRDLRRKRRFMPVTVRESLDWEQLSRIAVHSPDMPGIQTEMGQMRFYPLGKATGHVLGYVGAATEADLKREPQAEAVLALPGFRLGKSGIERQWEHELRGQAGNSQVEVNALGREIRNLSRSDGDPGKDLRLTLDADLQRFAYDRLILERSASAVLMDVHQGEVLVLASAPCFDPNHFSKGITHDYWRTMSTDPAVPLVNKAIAGQYPPGSTFKMITALAALEAGAIDPAETIFCRGHLKFGNHLFHCWRKEGHGHVDMRQALVQSCDTYFYEVAARIGVDRIAQMARRFGLGDRTGIDLPGEKNGLIPDRAWKEKNLGEKWQRGESLVAAIGQGYMLTTPLQLAVMTARLVNGGLAVMPRLVDSINGQKVITPPPMKIAVPPSHFKIIHDGMFDVVNGRRGTAYASRILTPGMEMGGKTGTAQVKRITMAERQAGVKNENLAWKFRHHALFVGYAPVDNPKFACAVVVEHGVGGSKTAAPIARDLLIAAQEKAAEGRIVHGLPADSKPPESKPEG